MAKPKDRYWSDAVAHHSNALDLEAGVFTLDNPREIALSLKRSAEASTRRKAPPFRSAMSMLTFFINRAGKELPEERRRVLDAAKDELRRVYGRVGRHDARRQALGTKQKTTSNKNPCIFD